MQEPNLTASEIISYAEKLEEESSRFYSGLAQKARGDNKEILKSFAVESEKNKVLVTRTYQETISDALEACFSFKGLSLGDFNFETTLRGDTDYPEALRMAIKLEEEAEKFYVDAAECSRALLATIPFAFRKVAKKRRNRKSRIQSLLKPTS